jgi:hypothetical protein
MRRHTRHHVLIALAVLILSPYLLAAALIFAVGYALAVAVDMLGGRK